ncbi:Aste57867_18142 [Aphanomyces stellatus]|uniref:Aste57867_18142 protein n=1 Tax=Aphanomyces stellatus TaxID=120398 RepID=A0A485LA67_9STRA|nr:hypothetical protein As57867_018080 [Aphanomyces stellatus]VFT94880.1 Aste57867_18142 [Aphanomyces stellatus]
MVIPGLKVSVPAFEKVPGVGLAPPHVEFEVERNYQDQFLSFKCRYSDFRQLMEKLKQAKDMDQGFPEFPPKIVQLPYILPSDAKLEERRAMLNAFVKELPHAELTLENTEAVRKFLKLDQVPEEAPSVSGMVPVPTTGDAAAPIDLTEADAPPPGFGAAVAAAASDAMESVVEKAHEAKAGIASEFGTTAP